MRRIIGLLAALLTLAPGYAETRNPLEALPLDALTATRERPLFRPTRRPPPPVPVAAPAPEPPPDAAPVAVAESPPFDLVGAVVGKDTAIALLRNRATNQILRLRPGDDAEGWRVATIGSRTVALERDGRTQSLALLATSPADAEVAGEPEPAESAAAPPAEVKRVAGRTRHER
jgi:general secretion pathway protein N